MLPLAGLGRRHGGASGTHRPGAGFPKSPHSSLTPSAQNLSESPTSLPPRPRHKLLPVGALRPGMPCTARGCPLWPGVGARVGPKPCRRLAWLLPVRKLSLPVPARSRTEPQLEQKWSRQDALPPAPSAPPLPLSTRRGRGHIRFLRAGGQDHTHLPGRLKAEKSGIAPGKESRHCTLPLEPGTSRTSRVSPRRSPSAQHQSHGLPGSKVHCGEERGDQGVGVRVMNEANQPRRLRNSPQR